MAPKICFPGNLSENTYCVIILMIDLPIDTVFKIELPILIQYLRLPSNYTIIHITCKKIINNNNNDDEWNSFLPDFGLP